MDTPHQRAEELYAGLWSLVDSGASLGAIASAPALMNLARPATEAATTDADPLARAIAAREELIAACKDLQRRDLAVEERHYDVGDAALILFGLGSGYAAKPLSARRQPVADKLGYDKADTAWKSRPGHRSHVQNLAYAVGEELLIREETYRRRNAALRAEATRHELTAITAQMMRRYELYYGIYTTLSALRGDLAAVLSLRADGPDGGRETIDDFVGLTLFDYAEYLAHKQRHQKEFGGIWMFGQADIEQAVADAVKLIEHFARPSYQAESLARLRLAEHGELDSFLTSLTTDAGGLLLLRNWRDLVFSCACPPDRPAPGACRVHAVMRACEFYRDVLDADWYRTIPWHDGPPPNLGLIDVATLYRDVGLSPPQ